MKSYLLLIYFVFVLLSVFACRKEEKKTLSRDEVREQQEMLLRVNKYLVKKDIELIESYSERRDWEMEVTESGLFYQIYEHGNGEKALNGKKVTINYVVSLLDGTICYDSENLGSKEFVLGKSNEESGLEQGVLMMRVGDKARFIMPPHLAHGLLGDENRIPARSIIVYEVELLDVSD
jgi:FKBP-type peptidyl-prolyl cis-trans isomerase FkpA